MKRNRLITLKPDKKIGCSSNEESPSTSLIKFDTTRSSSTTSFPECCHLVPFNLIIKQLGWRIRSRWRQLLIRRRRCNATTLRFNYDIRSYAQNFDDGSRRSVHDRRSPLAP